MVALQHKNSSFGSMVQGKAVRQISVRQKLMSIQKKTPTCLQAIGAPR